MTFWAFLNAGIEIDVIATSRVFARVETEIIDYQVKEGAPLFALTLFGHDRTAPAQVKVNFKSGLAFGDGCESATGSPVIDTVVAIRNYVNDRVFPVFRPLL